MEIEKLLRRNIKSFKPYSSARDEYAEKVGIFLDANENSFGSVSESEANRYPDPYQRQLKDKLAKTKNVAVEKIFLGNGSDEAIDLLIRAFCEPRQDSLIIMPPTYGMYKVCADLNDVQTIEVPLTKHFKIDLEQTLKNISDNTKLIFLCSPNNPTGNLLPDKEIKVLLDKFNGLVVVDEAYIDFANNESWIQKLKTYENLIVLQTFSKAWGLAGLRLGMAFSNPKIIHVLNNIKYPYNVNMLTQIHVEEALFNITAKERMVEKILSQRAYLEKRLVDLKSVNKVYPSDSNFLLVAFTDAKIVYQKLLLKQIIVRDRSSLVHCENCLRITVGTEAENQKLINALKEIEEDSSTSSL